MMEDKIDKDIADLAAGISPDRMKWLLQEMANEQATVDALVAALEPFANMPMPEKHGVERERIHKARAALALARKGGNQ